MEKRCRPYNATVLMRDSHRLFMTVNGRYATSSLYVATVTV